MPGERFASAPQTSILDASVTVLVITDGRRTALSEELQRLQNQFRSFEVIFLERRDRKILKHMEDAEGEVIVVMDADRSHCVEAIPTFVQGALDHELVMGNRFDRRSENLGNPSWMKQFFWRLISWSIRPLTRARDPLSGFFALRKSHLGKSQLFNPASDRIALELLVRGRLEDISEIPIAFEGLERKTVSSRLAEATRFIRHLKRLADFRFGEWSYTLQFLIVGASGTIVNIAVVTLLHLLGFSAEWSLVGGIVVSMTSNFLLNRTITFTYAKHQAVLGQFVRYALANSIGIAVNYSVARYMLFQFPSFVNWPQIPALAGIVAGTGFNFLTSRLWVFRAKPNGHTLEGR